MNKRACVVSGILGQDATYITSILLKEGWSVFGIMRPSTSANLWRLKEEGILDHPDLKLIECDLTDCGGIFKIVGDIKPEWFINLGAISAVGTSFDNPIMVSQTDAMGPLYCLEAIRQLSPDTRFYQASTSEMIANSKNADGLVDENTTMVPESPYAAAKLFSYNMVNIYKKAYNIFACSSILYNHSSKYRGDYFVEKKICKYVAQVKHGLQKDYLFLGNLDAARDIGHARDFMEGVCMAMSYKQPENFILATGKTYTIREILDIAFTYIGEDWTKYVKQDPKFMRPCEVHHLLGSYDKAKRLLGWEPKHTIVDILNEIIEADIKRCQNL